MGADGCYASSIWVLEVVVLYHAVACIRSYASSICVYLFMAEMRERRSCSSCAQSHTLKRKSALQMTARASFIFTMFSARTCGSRSEVTAFEASYSIPAVLVNPSVSCAAVRTW